jgi:hypothetical protein
MFAIIIDISSLRPGLLEWRYGFRRGIIGGPKLVSNGAIYLALSLGWLNLEGVI